MNAGTGTATTAAATAAIGFINAASNSLGAIGLALAVLSRTAERKVVTETTYHADGTTTVRTLSDVKAKPGQVTTVGSVESRNLTWETQRRRVNGRGPAPAALFGGQSVQIGQH